MRRVLFLAYHFPPVGGAGVQRSVKFVRYLPEHGYEPVVVTGPGAEASRWTPADASLGGEVPGGTTVRRIQGDPPDPARPIRARVERWLDRQEPFFRWWEQGADAAAQGETADLVYASMSPFESGAAAARIAARLGVPWVADLRDPWALDEMQAYPSRVHRRRDLRRMREVLASASAVVMNTDEAARRVRSFSGLSGPVVAIPNGFDPDDFASPAPERTPGFFRIVHAGYLHTELARGGVARAVRGLLGGAVPGVDVGTRSHVYLLRAVERLLTADPALAGRIEVHLAGVLSEADLAEARRSSVVRLHGYVSHAATVELLRSADLLFLPMQNLPEGTRATIVPGKTYEYLAAGRPILAAVPDGDARDLLARVPTATLCRPADVAGIADAVLGELRRKDRGERLPEVPAALLAPFERQQLTARLADVFDAVLGVSPPLASADRVAV